MCCLARGKCLMSGLFVLQHPRCALRAEDLAEWPSLGMLKGVCRRCTNDSCNSVPAGIAGMWSEQQCPRRLAVPLPLCQPQAFPLWPPSLGTVSYLPGVLRLPGCRAPAVHGTRRTPVPSELQGKAAPGVGRPGLAALQGPVGEGGALQWVRGARLGCPC